MNQLRLRSEGGVAAASRRSPRIVQQVVSNQLVRQEAAQPPEEIPRGDVVATLPAEIPGDLAGERGWLIRFATKKHRAAL